MEEAARALRRQVDRDGPAAGALAVDGDLEMVEVAARAHRAYVSDGCPPASPPPPRGKHANQVRVAAKVANVVLDPLERKALVLDAEVGDLAIAVGSGKMSGGGAQLP